MSSSRKAIVATLVVLLSAVASGPAVHASPQNPDPPRWLLSMFSWLAAVNTHTPGQIDAAIGAGAGMRLADVEDVLTDVLALRERLHAFDSVDAASSAARPGVITYRGREFTVPQLRRFMGMKEGDLATAGVNRLLRRAAVYHADLAVLSSGEGAAAGAAARPGRSSVVIGDGQQVRTSTSTIHWAAGRRLLDSLRPGPARDPLALAWYAAGGATLQAQRLLTEADDHLSRARQIFPDDAQLLFQGACVLETLAAPAVQAALGAQRGLLRSAGASRMVPNRPSARSLLDRAEQLFRRALQQDGALVEARVRLARLTAGRGQHAEAIDLLNQALAAAPPDDVRYLALMTLGDERLAIGRRAEAAARYEDAARLFPTAQSPLLALALVARESGDRVAAAAALDRLAGLPAEPENRVDPSWGYYVMQGRDANELLERLRLLAQQDLP